jgi:hypothetical protein
VSLEHPTNSAAVGLEASGKVADMCATLVGQDQVVHRAGLESSLNLPHRVLNEDSLDGLIVMATQIGKLEV